MLKNTVIKLYSAVATLAIASNKQSNLPGAIMHSLVDTHAQICWYIFLGQQYHTKRLCNE